MKKRIEDIIISIGLFIVGLCMLLWAEKVTNLVSIIFGILIILYGIFAAISYFKNEEKTTIYMIYAIVFIVMGTVLVSKPEIMAEIISFIIGIYILLSSIATIKLVLDNKQAKNYNISLGLSIAGIIISILCIIGKLLIPNIILQFVGLLLIVYGVINIINAVVVPSK